MYLVSSYKALLQFAFNSFIYVITFCILYLHNFYISKLQFSRSVFSDIVLPFKLKNYLGGNLGQKSDIFGRSGRGRVLCFVYMGAGRSGFAQGASF